MTSRKPSIRWEKVLNSVCGFGPRTGARTLAEIGDPHRFANPGRLAAYAGLAPVDRQSGRSHRTGRSRGGNHRLHNAAVICVARRRCNIILAMLKTQTPYRPRHPEKLPDAA